MKCKMIVTLLHLKGAKIPLVYQEYKYKDQIIGKYEEFMTS